MGYSKKNWLVQLSGWWVLVEKCWCVIWRIQQSGLKHRTPYSSINTDSFLCQFSYFICQMVLMCIGNKWDCQKFEFPSTEGIYGFLRVQKTFPPNFEPFIVIGLSSNFINEFSPSISPYVFFIFPNFPPNPPLGGVSAPPGGVFELMDRFRWNLAQMVLNYVRIHWHCQKFETPPFPHPQGGVHAPPQGDFLN